MSIPGFCVDLSAANQFFVLELFMVPGSERRRRTFRRSASWTTAFLASLRKNKVVISSDPWGVRAIQRLVHDGCVRNRARGPVKSPNRDRLYSPYISVINFRNRATLESESSSIFFLSLCLLMTRSWNDRMTTADPGRKQKKGVRKSAGTHPGGARSLKSVSRRRHYWENGTSLKNISLEPHRHTRTHLVAGRKNKRDFPEGNSSNSLIRWLTLSGWTGRPSKYQFRRTLN